MSLPFIPKKNKSVSCFSCLQTYYTRRNYMNIAVIFAGGTGQRMNSKTLPKQFLKLHGKPIIIYTLEQFQNHPKIDKIIIVCIESWIQYCYNLTILYKIDKLDSIVPGGENGQLSICQGIKKAHELYDENSVILVHDGVRPLVDKDTISKAIISVQKNGSAITIAPVTETIVERDIHGRIKTIIARNQCKIAKAPQCFFLKDLYTAHTRALSEHKINFIDSASLMYFYGYNLYTIEGNPDNIKITTPSDFYTFRALLDAQENSQIFGV